MDSRNKKLTAGLGLAAAIAAAAGFYFLYGSKNAAKNRKKIAGWMLQAKGEILERLEGLTDISEQVYNAVISDVADKYQTVRNIDKKDIYAMAKELKTHWKKIVRDAKKL